MKVNIEAKINPVLFWGAIIFIMATLFFAHQSCKRKIRDAESLAVRSTSKVDSLSNELQISNSIYVVDSAQWQAKLDSANAETDWYRSMYELGLRQASEVNQEAQKLAEQVRKENGKKDTSCLELSNTVISLNGKLANMNQSAKNTMDAAIVSQKIRDSIILAERADKKRLADIHDATMAEFHSLMRSAKAYQPRSAVYMGFAAQVSKVNLIDAIGGGFTLVTKKGKLYTVNLMAQPWNNWQPAIEVETKFKISFK